MILLSSIHRLHSGLKQNMLQSLKDEKYENVLSLHQKVNTKIRKIMERRLTDINQDIAKLESSEI